MRAVKVAVLDRIAPALFSCLIGRWSQTIRKPFSDGFDPQTDVVSVSALRHGVIEMAYGH